MKSNKALIGISILCLAMAAIASAAIWGEVASAVKIGMYAFGFGSGVTVGAMIVRRQIFTQ